MTLHDMMLYYYDMIDYMTTVILSIILEARGTRLQDIG